MLGRDHSQGEISPGAASVLGPGQSLGQISPVTTDQISPKTRIVMSVHDPVINSRDRSFPGPESVLKPE